MIRYYFDMPTVPLTIILTAKSYFCQLWDGVSASLHGENETQGSTDDATFL